MLPKNVTSEDSTPKVQKITEEIPKETSPEVILKPDIPKSTPRKKSIPKRIQKKPMDVIVPSKEKYKRLYEIVDVTEFTDRDLERMAYLAEHGVKWDEIFGMSVTQVDDSIQEIKSKMTKAELERDGLIFYLKASNHKNKQLKNMKTETLKKLVNDVKESIQNCNKTLLLKMKKKVEENKVLRERLAELEKSKRRRIDVHSSVFDTQKSLLEARIKELDATKLNPNVNVEVVSKEIYSTHTTEASVKVSKESKATWFKKKPESSSKMVDNLEVD
ncbi:hypothetical protein L1987_48594 [Smallanthus sonchifolius]|uniref:Uncharacterized protein n=1 Tax=Smallanthus sonchifolius TaxID=185202 RepID=A0ACB9FSW0_9ASTR|nr:hypothetical protein L1987_48594 [Smallanthus sonchifolius]